MHRTIGRVCRFLSNSLRRYGVRATAHDFVCRVINKVVRFQILKGMTVRPEDMKEPSVAPGFTWRFVTDDELTQFAADEAYDLTVEFLNKARARGDRCYGCFEGEKLVSYSWYSHQPTPIDEYFVLHFDRAYTYMYKGYTLPAYRGKRLYTMGMCQALRAFTEEGRKGLLCYVLSNNFASLRSIARMGYKTFGRVYAFHAGGHSFSYATPGCRRFNLWVKSSDRPRNLGWAKGATPR